MQIACCQVDTVWHDKEASYARAEQLLEAASLQQGALVLLPEMFSTGFDLNVAALVESERAETEGFISSLAQRLRVYMMGGVVNWGSGGKGRNEAVVFDPGGELVCRYCKMHPFSFAGESLHFESGDRISSFDWGEIRVGPFICYDLRFPEAFRAAVGAGAQLLTVIANWPQARQDHWLALVRARAIENQSYMAAANRCGRDPNHTYVGGSQIVDPQGNVLADAGPQECVITAEVDLDALEQYRQRFPALRDMRDDLILGREC